MLLGSVTNTTRLKYFLLTKKKQLRETSIEQCSLQTLFHIY